MKARDYLRKANNGLVLRTGPNTKSLEYKINAFKETGTGIWQNLLDRGDIGTVIDMGTQVLELFDKLTEKIGLFGTLTISGGALAGIMKIS
ncbi:hypothetical protein [uncultured Dysosmobacter sp.]|uniref:hypothetical protein n=1 Tax=uncultured Dysosmobacter sp. TaxID=2591384 RepID=UPI0026120670|nr:hypothetical protein [uncultured Dysosmobacter sp.]